jgi:hypothetical protein
MKLRSPIRLKVQTFSCRAGLSLIPFYMSVRKFSSVAFARVCSRPHPRSYMTVPSYVGGIGSGDVCLTISHTITTLYAIPLVVMYSIRYSRTERGFALVESATRFEGVFETGLPTGPDPGEDSNRHAEFNEQDTRLLSQLVW